MIAENRQGGGALFRLSLPLLGLRPPELADFEESEMDSAEPS
jgi:hypothetical protein